VHRLWPIRAERMLANIALIRISPRIDIPLLTLVAARCALKLEMIGMQHIHRTSATAIGEANGLLRALGRMSRARPVGPFSRFAQHSVMLASHLGSERPC
jgi:hypothetical protein